MCVCFVFLCFFRFFFFFFLRGPFKFAPFKTTFLDKKGNILRILCRWSLMSCVHRNLLFRFCCTAFSGHACPANETPKFWPPPFRNCTLPFGCVFVYAGPPKMVFLPFSGWQPIRVSLKRRQRPNSAGSSALFGNWILLHKTPASRSKLGFPSSGDQTTREAPILILILLRKAPRKQS